MASGFQAMDPDFDNSNAGALPRYWLAGRGDTGKNDLGKITSRKLRLPQFDGNMSSESVTFWLKQLSQGSHGAADQLWKRYSAALHRIARVRLCHGSPVEDEDDLAQSVFVVLWKGAERGDWNELKNREELWWLLLEITRRKALEHNRHWSVQKRGGQGNSVSLPQIRSDDSTAGFVEFPDARAVPPDADAIVREEHDRLITALGNDTLRAVAAMRLDGQSHAEIATELGVSLRTVIRKLNLIKTLWSREIEI